MSIHVDRGSRDPVLLGAKVPWLPDGSGGEKGLSPLARLTHSVGNVKKQRSK